MTWALKPKLKKLSSNYKKITSFFLTRFNNVVIYIITLIILITLITLYILNTLIYNHTKHSNL